MTTQGSKYLYVNNNISSYIGNVLYNDSFIANRFMSSKISSNPEKRIKWIKSNIDKFLFPVSSLYFLMVTDKRIKSNKEFINLNMETMKRVIGWRMTKPIVDFLIGSGILECDYIWSVGVKSCGYKFAPKWLSLWENGELRFTRRETQLNIKCTYLDKFTNSEFISKCFQSLSFDHDLAQNIKNEYLATLDKKKAIEKEIYYDFVIDAWQNKDYFLKMSRKSGRIFTLLSSTPRNLRKCLKLGGQNIFICDIKSCQPLLLCSFYDEKTEESQKYKEIVESGLFYKTIITGLKEDFNDKVKEIYKEMIWEWAFGEKTWPKTKDIENYFKSNFPYLEKKIKETKKRISNDEKKPHAKVAVKLQSMEASVMVNELVPFCKENNILYLTIHDSFLCKKEDINRLITFVTGKFKEKFDLTPNFDIKEVA